MQKKKFRFSDLTKTELWRYHPDLNWGIGVLQTYH